MKKQEFLDKLEQLLSDMPEGEREEAVMYYSDYIDDAGPEKEDEVIAALGCPEEVAESIRNDSREGEFTEQGYQDKKVDKFKGNTNIVKTEDADNGSENGQGTYTGGVSGNTFGSGNDGTYVGGTQTSANGQNTNSNATTGKKKMSEETMAWTIVAIVLTSPLWISVLASLLGVIVTAACSFVGFAIAGVVLLIVSIILLITGIVTLFSSCPIGMMILGIAFILAAIGLVLLAITCTICRYFIPWLWRCMKSLWNKIFGKREVAGA